MPATINGAVVGGGGASAPAGTGVVTASGGAFVDPVPSAATTRSTLGLGSLATASSITASQVSDSTAAGRAVLTAADATAQRTALGLGNSATRAVGSGSGDVAAGNVLDGVGAGLNTTAGVGQTAADGNVRTIDWTATGATTTNGNGTASATASVVTLSLTSVQTSAYNASGGYTAPRAQFAIQSSWTAPAINPQRYEFTARLAWIGAGRTVNTVVSILVESTSGTRKYGVYLNQSAATAWTAAGAGSGLATPASVSVGWDGTDWLRIRVEADTLTFYFGKGVGSAEPLPTAWTQVYTSALAATIGSPGWATITLALIQGVATGGSGLSLTFDNVTLRRLP